MCIYLSYIAPDITDVMEHAEFAPLKFAFGSDTGNSYWYVPLQSHQNNTLIWAFLCGSNENNHVNISYAFPSENAAEWNTRFESSLGVHNDYSRTTMTPIEYSLRYPVPFSHLIADRFASSLTSFATLDHLDVQSFKLVYDHDLTYFDLQESGSSSSHSPANLSQVPDSLNLNIPSTSFDDNLSPSPNVSSPSPMSITSTEWLALENPQITTQNQFFLFSHPAVHDSLCSSFTRPKPSCSLFPVTQQGSPVTSIPSLAHVPPSSFTSLSSCEPVGPTYGSTSTISYLEPTIFDSVNDHHSTPEAFMARFSTPTPIPDVDMIFPTAHEATDDSNILNHSSTGDGSKHHSGPSQYDDLSPLADEDIIVDDQGSWHSDTYVHSVDTDDIKITPEQHHLVDRNEKKPMARVPTDPGASTSHPALASTSTIMDASNRKKVTRSRYS
jgi:hypothetical protein